MKAQGQRHYTGISMSEPKKRHTERLRTITACLPATGIVFPDPNLTRVPSCCASAGVWIWRRWRRRSDGTGEKAFGRDVSVRP